MAFSKGMNRSGRLRVEVVVPVYNEERDLPRSLSRLQAFLQENCDYDWQITIADNASTDGTPEVGQELATRHERVRYVRLPLKGRGRALRHVWLASEADIVSYMDVDLATDLSCFLPLLERLVRGEAEIAIGSRYQRGARVTRGWKRELFSRGYMLLLKMFFGCSFSDAQCGFKAATRRAVQTLVPLVENQGWFFDAELLLLAEHYGFTIAEVPVIWTDDPDSRVKMVPTISEHFIGLLRMRLAFSTGFAAVPAANPVSEVYA
ncbi:MAG: glycosyltransferase family 2 protein [candidate division KSB1 bacterium]|nr:glycosyltransferase family 2 protein [candidate division KSB1 bacterium]MDZ7275293.1 glycosyltransferase family 2 protein [candidate division KSB1 bacterium]MDZ7287461.1 glycosyltransferase family 2 protein [candidate division KSB1 bacterium]MDZ7299575.1 glycosyltransferase family 2 protein [candidate division KSB1 bacterium]MDZ7307327.1 glycosyltransferase family 2 protein [candidate division KSB1 bacterium]